MKRSSTSTNSSDTKTVGDLAPAPYNPRRISDAKLEALGRSMQAFGDLSGVVYNRRTHRLVGGHQRAKHLPKDATVTVTERFETANAQGTVARGYVEHAGERWTYREVDWDEPTEMAANVAANKHGGEWDIGVLAELLASFDSSGDAALIGFDSDELQRILSWNFASEAGPTDPRAEWVGMPEYENEDQLAWKSVKVNFQNAADLAAFAKLVGQVVLPTTRSIWFPRVPIEHVADKAYVVTENS